MDPRYTGSDLSANSAKSTSKTSAASTSASKRNDNGSIPAKPLVKPKLRLDTSSKTLAQNTKKVEELKRDKDGYLVHDKWSAPWPADTKAKAKDKTSVAQLSHKMENTHINNGKPAAPARSAQQPAQPTRPTKPAKSGVMASLLSGSSSKASTKKPAKPVIPHLTTSIVTASSSDSKKDKKSKRK